MALMTSLELGALGPIMERTEGGGQEFNSYTLLGADQDLYLALVEIVESAGVDEMKMESLVNSMVAHIERGISQIAVRVKSPGDAARLMSGAAA